MSTVWPGGCSKGELTTGGQLQARDLGAWLRQRYVEQAKILPSEYQVRKLLLSLLNTADSLQ